MEQSSMRLAVPTMEASAPLNTLMRRTGRLCPYMGGLLAALGSWQLLQAGGQNLLSNYMQPRLNHWCRLPDSSRGKNESIPRDSEGRFETCRMYRTYKSSDSDDNVTKVVAPCVDGWTYDMDGFTATATTEWDLVCDKFLVYELVTPAYMAAMTVAALVAGPISDRFGRRRILVTGIFSALIGAAGVTMSPHEWAYLAGRFVVGFGMRLSADSCYILGLEFVNPDYRAVWTTFWRVNMAVGTLITNIIAYFIRHFRLLQIVTIAPVSLYLILWWVMPESPRWLISRGYISRGRKALLHLSRKTQANLPRELIEKCLETKSNKQSSSYSELFQHRMLVNRFLITGYIKTVASFVFWAVSLNMGDLAGNLYVNYALSALIELPALILATISTQKLGRKRTGMAMFFLISVAGLLSIVLQSLRLTAIYVTVCTVGIRILASCAMLSCTTLSGELFPSSMRQSTIAGTGAMSACVMVFAPVAGGYLGEVWPQLPSLLFTVFATVAVLVMALLPESHGCPLPETVAEALTLGQKNLARNGSLKSNQMNAPMSNGSTESNSTNISCIGTYRLGNEDSSNPCQMTRL